MPLTKHTHFVGFRGDEFTRAVIIFGPPDFIHKWHDHRMYGDVGDGDVIIFANKATEADINPFTWQDHELN